MVANRFYAERVIMYDSMGPRFENHNACLHTFITL